jgi:hypothetical protein
MPRFILFISIIIVALLQTLLFPWLHFFGGPVPLVMVCLAVISVSRPALLLWLGIAGGLTLDSTAITYFGIWTLFYALAGLALQQIVQQPRPRWWWRVIWIAGVVLVMPLYTQAVFGQIHPGLWLQIAIIPAISAGLILLIPCWLASRRTV